MVMSQAMSLLSADLLNMRETIPDLVYMDIFFKLSEFYRDPTYRSPLFSQDWTVDGIYYDIVIDERTAYLTVAEEHAMEPMMDVAYNL